MNRLISFWNKISYNSRRYVCYGWKHSAVSNAGGLGLIGSGSMYSDVLEEHILKCKKATNNPFE